MYILRGKMSHIKFLIGGAFAKFIQVFGYARTPFKSSSRGFCSLAPALDVGVTFSFVRKVVGDNKMNHCQINRWIAFVDFHRRFAKIVPRNDSFERDARVSDHYRAVIELCQRNDLYRIKRCHDFYSTRLPSFHPAIDLSSRGTDSRRGGAR